MKSSKSTLLSSEDYWAIWLGSFFLLSGILIYIVFGGKSIQSELLKNQKVLEQQSKDVPFKSVARYEAEENLKKINLFAFNIHIRSSCFINGLQQK